MPGTETYAQRELSDIAYVVIHHSAVNVDSSAESVARYHIERHGWPGIGYHFLVHWDGTIDYVGDILTVRYNVASRNREVLGICCTGNFMEAPPSSAQRHAVHLLCMSLKRTLQRDVPVVGHRDIALPSYETTCPGNSWVTWRFELQ